MRLIFNLILIFCLVSCSFTLYAADSDVNVVADNEQYFNNLILVIGSNREAVGISDPQIIYINHVSLTTGNKISDLNNEAKALDAEIETLAFEAPYDIDTTNMLVSEKNDLISQKQTVINDAINKIKKILTHGQRDQIDAILKQKGNN